MKSTYFEREIVKSEAKRRENVLMMPACERHINLFNIYCLLHVIFEEKLREIVIRYPLSPLYCLPF